MSVEDRVLGLGAGVWLGQAPALLRAAEAIGGIDFIELYADEPSELLEARRAIPKEVAIVLHSASLSLPGADAIPEELIASTREVADSLHALWVIEDLGVWRLDGQRPVGSPFWPPYLDEATAALVASRVGPLAGRLGRPFLCELPPLDVVVGPCTPAAFMSEVVRRSGCGWVLDVSHWLRDCQAAGLDPDDLDGLPLDNVVELHISGGKRRPGARWYDEEHSAHLLPECLDLLERILARCPAARAVTVESHGAPDDVLAHALAAVAERPSVRALRARAAALPIGAVTAGNAATLERAPSAIADRQRLIRRLLEHPGLLEQVEQHAPDMDTACEVRRVPPALWREAQVRRLRQLPGLTRIARFVCEQIWTDLGTIFVDLLASRPDEAPAPAAEDILDYLLTRQDVPDWACDALRFDRDVLRVAEGVPPKSAYVKKGRHTWVVQYPRSVVSTLNAIATGGPIPDPIPTEVCLRTRNRQLDVQERTMSR